MKRFGSFRGGGELIPFSRTEVLMLMADIPHTDPPSSLSEQNRTE